MSETIKTGGVGKSPAIEKINRLNALSSRMQAAAELERRAFDPKQDKAKEILAGRKRIVDEFDINFKKVWGREK